MNDMVYDIVYSEGNTGLSYIAYKDGRILDLLETTKDVKRFRIIILKNSEINPNDFHSEHWTEREAELEIEHLNYGFPLGLLVKTSDWSLTKVYINSSWYIHKPKQLMRSME